MAQLQQQPNKNKTDSQILIDVSLTHLLTLEQTLRFVDGIKHYIHAAQMMAKGLVIQTLANSEAEKDATALAQILVDIESHVLDQDQAYRSNYEANSPLLESITAPTAAKPLTGATAPKRAARTAKQTGAR